MPSPTHSDLLAAFSTERDRRLLALPLRMPDRTRELISLESGGLCVFCGNPGMSLAHLVPHGSGGPSRMPNLVLSCRGCHKRRSNGDWDALDLARPDGRTLSPALTAQRMEALALCPQHPVPPAGRRTLDDCRAHLASTRWAHPRVPFLIAMAGDRILLAALQLPLSEAGVSLLSEVREAGGRSEGDGVWSIGRTEWDAVVWKLIDRHAILYCTARDGHGELAGAHAATRSWRERWDVLFDDLVDARRDAPRKRHHGFQVGARSRSWMAAQARRA